MMKIYDYFCNNFEYYKDLIPKFIYDEYDEDKYVIIDNPDCEIKIQYYDYDLISSCTTTHLHYINNIWRLIVKHYSNDMLDLVSKKEITDFVINMKNDHFIARLCRN